MSLALAMRRRAMKVAASGPAVSDTFNRANSTTTMGNADTGQPWVPNSGVWGIIDNRAYKVSGGDQATVVVDSGLADGTVKTTFTEVAGGSGGQCFRSTDDLNNFVTEVAAAGLGIYRRQAGGFTGIASWGVVATAGSLYEVVLAGSSINVKRNGASLAQVTDAFQATATRHGLRVGSGTIPRFDDFSVTA